MSNGTRPADAGVGVSACFIVAQILSTRLTIIVHWGKPRCYEVDVKSVTRDNIDEWSPSFEPRLCVSKPGVRKEKMAPLASMWYNMHFDSFLHQRYALFDFFFAG